MTGTFPRVQLAPGYSISRVLKGGWQLASGHGASDLSAAAADMDRFADAGITTFDCADIYTGVETRIGDWLSSRRGRSGAAPIQVHTKYVPDLDRLPTHSRDDVARGIDRSLARLRVDCLDVVQLHWWDYDVPGYVEAAAWLDDLRRAGKIRHVGLTNFDLRRLREIVAAGVSVVSHQVQYSVLDRRPSPAMAAECAANDIGLLCYGALAGGFLSGRYLGAAAPDGPLENRSLVKYQLIVDEFGGWNRFQRMLAALDRIATRHGVGLGAVALRWVLDQPAVSGVIVGARHAGHLDDVCRAATLTLDDDDRTAIADVQREANGPAGDVYALERVKGGRHASVMRYALNRDPHRAGQPGP
jgi:aryl-alcohol dehydrogenase-like predicted oxidoreductase